MMNKETGQPSHWTQESVTEFVYSISSSFMAQLETRMEEKQVSRSELASLLGKSNGRVSQLFNNPGNLSLRVIVELSQALGMKAGILAYDDEDSANNKGPINPDVFVESWKKLDCPSDLFRLEEAYTNLKNQVASFAATSPISGGWPTISAGYLGTQVQPGYCLQQGAEQSFSLVAKTPATKEAA
jgi:transcriptional regulator with XRE-family HTH domain